MGRPPLVTARLDDVPRAMAPVWRNALGNQRCAPQHHLVPGDLADLVTAVTAAHEEGLRVRVAGRGHGLSPLVPTQDVLLRSERMSALLGVHGELLTVEAGMTVGALVQHAARHGLALTGLSMRRDHTVGGLLSTGGHGTGLAHGALSDQVVALTLVSGTGEVVTMGPEDPRLDAARLSLGALGALYSVTLRAHRAFRVRVEEEVVPLEPVIAHLDRLAREAEFLDVVWLPSTGEAWVRRGWRTDEPADWSWRDRARARALERVGHAVGPAALGATTWWPSATPTVLGMARRLGRPARSAVRTAADALQPVRGAPPLWDCGVATPLEHAAEALALFVDWIREEAADHRYPVNLAVQARFVRGSSAWLSPTAGRDSCFLTALAAPTTPGVQAFYGDITGELMDRFDARPHWGRVVCHPERVRAAYGTSMSRFEAVRRRLDPGDTFLNPFLARLVRG